MKPFIILILSFFILNPVCSQIFSIDEIKDEVFTSSGLTFVSDYHLNEKYRSRDYTFVSDDTTQHVLVSTPNVPKPVAGYPVIIMIHGYITPSHYSTFDSYKYIFNRYASSEFMVFKPDLRGHGRSERGDNWDDNLTLLYYHRDILNLIAGIKTMPDADSRNIFLMGHSNGGNQVIRVLVSKPEFVKAASLWGPTSVTLEESNFFWKGGGKKKYGDGALSNSDGRKEITILRDRINQSLEKFGDYNSDNTDFFPYLGNIVTPIVIRHPDTDESVPYSWSVDFVDKFRESGNSGYIRLVNYPGDNHNIAANQYSAQMADLDWFRSFLIED